MANRSSAEEKARDSARSARKTVRRAVVVNADSTVNSADEKPISPQAVRHAIRAFQRWPRLVEEVKLLKLRKYQNGANPALYQSAEYKKMLGSNILVFSKVGKFNPAAVEEVPQRRVQPP